MGVPWGQHGGTLVVPWRDHGGNMGVPWGQHGGTMGATWGYHGGDHLTLTYTTLWHILYCSIQPNLCSSHIRPSPQVGAYVRLTKQLYVDLLQRMGAAELGRRKREGGGGMGRWRDEGGRWRKGGGMGERGGEWC